MYCREMHTSICSIDLNFDSAYRPKNQIIKKHLVLDKVLFFCFFLQKIKLLDSFFKRFASVQRLH